MNISFFRGLLVVLITASCVLLSSFVRADVGANNPNGLCGQFNGNVTTGCSYDPFTSNAFRSITDISVANGTGSYPLAFTRTMNSRGPTYPAFGKAGSWTHNYQWNILPISHKSNLPNWTPTGCTICYPDGRVVVFSTQGTDPYERGPAGVRDRFQANGFGGDCYLHLPDGGKIWFQASVDMEDTTPDGWVIYTYTFTFMGIIDPYGQITTVTYPADGSMTITEPAGRMLKIFYKTGPANDTVVDRVEEWMTSALKGRTVTYNYSTYSASGTNYSALTSVTYPDSITATYSYQNDNNFASGIPLIKTAIDPMYEGPMWKIAYTFVTNGVYGQLQSENYFDGTNVGAAVSSLTVTGTSTRKETRGDGATRTFTYTGYDLTSSTDFKGISASKAYDSKGFIKSVTNRNGNTTAFTNDPWTGNPTVTTYPLTPSDTALGLGQATTQAVYGSSSCPDPNNRDANNPYYIYTYQNKTKQGRARGNMRKRGLSVTYLRDTSKRLATINYPDSGTETYTYNSFGQVLQHRLKAGGLETYTYDSRGLLTQYRDAYHLLTADPQNPSVPTNATPSLAYTYDSLDRLQSITDARSNATSFTYNNRRQPLTETPPGVIHPITNVYNANGTLASVSNELQKQTSYVYDDYKRLTSVTLPPPSGGPSPSPTSSSYDHTGGSGADYTHTDANPTRLVLPSGKTTTTVYDNDLLKSSVTVGYGTSDAATTTFVYDNNGNLTKITDPKGNLTQNYYDQQNRLVNVDDAMVNDATTPHKNSNGHTTSYIYDQANDTLTTLRANNQLITNVYDSMNRLIQKTAPQDPDPAAVTKYTYTTAGLLQTMQDPHLVAISSTSSYSYAYDLMARKIGITYPPDSNSVVGTEVWSYDMAGNLATFTDRAAGVQTFSYDTRNRQTGFSWSDGTTPWQTIAYDDASRITQIANSNATINNAYFDDNTLKSQEEWATDENTHRIVNYTYDPDLNRSTIGYPGSDTFSYAYTNRNQIASIHDTTASNYPATYSYDADGDVYSETEGGVVTTTATFNAMNFATHLSRTLGTTRTFDYQYNVMDDRTSIQQDGGTPKTYTYDLAEQSDTETISGVATTFDYDANGNRTGVNGTGTYATNNLNEYTTFNGLPIAYDNDGNLTSYNGGTYAYDAQNRMISAVNTGTTETFKYDGLNHKISQTVNGVTTYNVWDGWNLIEEFTPGASTPTNSYVYGSKSEILERINSGSNVLYFQDALGNTSHVSDASGNLLESYTYSRTGQPTFYNASGTQIGASTHDIRHLFHGQLWTQATGLNDYRNRVQLPSMGIFMQTDPIRFSGDPTHLYRFCGNNAFNTTDSTGLRPDGYNLSEYRTPWDPYGIYNPTYFVYVSFGAGPSFSGGLNGETIFTANTDLIASAILVGGGSVSAGVVSGEVFHGSDSTLSLSGVNASGITLAGGTISGVSVGGFLTDTSVGVYTGITIPGTNIGVGIGVSTPAPPSDPATGPFSDVSVDLPTSPDPGTTNGSDDTNGIAGFGGDLSLADEDLPH
jgi:RHS repeat-associated protein